MRSLPTLSVLDAPPDADTNPNTDPSLSPLKPDLALQNTLGEGGMGVVRAAQQCALGRSVAVKLLRANDDTPQRRNQAQALLREALIMGQLEHPNVIPVYTLGKLGPQQPALVMKRVEGVSWHALIHDPNHPRWLSTGAGDDRLGFHLSVLSQVCRALEFAHSRGILHRDVKPENVMIGEYGEVYLLDWGVALHLRERDAAQGPALLGTPAYMAPEMARGEVPAIDARSDVYLLGATLHEVLTGRPPHAGSTLLAVLYAAAASAPAALNESVPAELARILHRATAADPAQRFPDVASLREAVTAYLQHRGSLALSDEAQAQARALRALLNQAQAQAREGSALAAAQAQEAQTLFAACAFGFQMASRAWPGNANARQGLHATVEAMARFELARGDVEHASRLLAQHPDAADAALRAEVSHRLDALRSGRQDLDALIRMRDDMDISRNQRQRQQLFAWFGAASVLLSAVIIGSTPEDALMSWTQLFGALALMSALMVGVGWRLRKALMRTAIDRRIMASLGVFLVALWIQRLTGWVNGLSISRSFHNDLQLSVLGCAMIAVFADRRLGWVALPFLGGILGAQAFPTRVATMFGVSGMVGIGTLLLLFRAPKPKPQA